ncbi:37S ribosomal protein S9, mitochondrial [Gnomoniopsis smithogilvyi]|uniref:Small ribosomal subunit protein uS9m n=1 Tax=Gnomoniopsis smithogilvyi TaxID=1191159 RepID=A0A9W8YRX9_9PEZI|nr:37S ribosomal protein S9, mitochondrial [Gnomoniopsis smithogilvyi]
MATLRPAFTQLRGRCRTSAPQCQQIRHMLQGLHISPKARHTRPLSTLPSGPNDAVPKDEIATFTEVDQGAGDLGTASKLITTAEVSLSGPHREGDAPGRVYEYRPLVNRPRWGDRPKQAALGQMDGEGSHGDDVGSSLREVGRREDPNKDASQKIHARAVPVSPSYFSRQPEFNDSYLLLQKLMRKYAHLPTVPSDQLKRVAFRTLKDYRLAVGEDVKASEYARCMTLVKRLNKIHPKLAPPNIKDAIEPFTRDIDPHLHKAKDIPVDRFGRTLGVGKRKTSVARAWVVEGVGEVLVNGKSLADAFGRIHDRESAVWALKATARTDKYNVWALVEGGGTTGQAEALAMAVGKALMAHEPALKPALRRAGVVTRDPRGVERKKPGHLKARKKPAWVKR